MGIIWDENEAVQSGQSDYEPSSYDDDTQFSVTKIISTIQNCDVRALIVLCLYGIKQTPNTCDTCMQ